MAVVGAISVEGTLQLEVILKSASEISKKTTQVLSAHSTIILAVEVLGAPAGIVTL